MEVPVITTGRVAAGVRTQQGDEPPLRHVEGLDEFTQAVISRLLASNRDRRPDSAARAFVAAHFNWETCGRRLEEAIEQAISVNRQGKAGRVCHSV